MICMYFQTAQVCVRDEDTRCSKWGEDGFCNPEKGYGDFMKRKCCATCRRHTSGKYKTSNAAASVATSLRHLHSLLLIYALSIHLNL